MKKSENIILIAIVIAIVLSLFILIISRIITNKSKKEVTNDTLQDTEVIEENNAISSTEESEDVATESTVQEDISNIPIEERPREENPVDDARIGPNGVKSSRPVYTEEELDEIERRYQENFSPNIIVDEDESEEESEVEVK